MVGFITVCDGQYINHPITGVRVDKKGLPDISGCT